MADGPWEGVFSDQGTTNAKHILKAYRRLEGTYEQLVHNYNKLVGQYRDLESDRDHWINKASSQDEQVEKLQAQVESLSKKHQHDGKLLSVVLPRAEINQQKDVYHRMHIDLLEVSFVELATEHLNVTKDEALAEIKKIKARAQAVYAEKTGGKPHSGRVNIQDVFSLTP